MYRYAKTKTVATLYVWKLYVRNRRRKKLHGTKKKEKVTYFVNVDIISFSE